MKLCRNLRVAQAVVAFGFIAFVGGFFALLLSGCESTSGVVQLPRAPAWRQPSDIRVFQAYEVATRVRDLRPGIPIFTSDARYTLVSHAWLEEYLDWTWAAAKATGVRYTPESWDCDEFALAFHLLATRKAAQAGVETSPLIARLVVLDRNGRHLLNGVATDRGIFVIEPQPDAGPFRMTPLADYKPMIQSVVLGDYVP